jgi:hypothetical protein
MSIQLPAGVPTWDTAYLVPAPWNPNKQTDRTFKNLVDAIREVGFLEPVVTAPIPAENAAEYLSPEQIKEGIKKFRLIVGGKHRWDAATVLDMPRVPVVETDFSEDMVKLQNVRLNALKGKMDPEKFQKLYMEMLDKGYEEELLKTQMGLVEEKAFKGLVSDIKKDLPPEMRSQVEKAEAAGNLGSVDDLQRVLNELFSAHGDTLPANYMVFEYGGKTVVWVQMDRPALEAVRAITDFCYTRKLDINRALAHLLKDGLDRLEEAREELLADTEDMFD